MSAALAVCEVANVVRAAGGRVRTVCVLCGRLSRPLPSAGLFDLPSGWSMAPYPREFAHPDGSHGDLFTCRPCGERRDFPIAPAVPRGDGRARRER